MGLPDFSQEDLEQWRAAPVAQVMRECLARSIGAQKRQAMEAYWAGKPWSEADRLSLRRMELVVEDLFEATADDMNAMMEAIDEYERDTTS